MSQMKSLVFFFTYVFLCVSAQAIPLQTWPDWVATAPYISRQVPPSAMIMRGAGTDEYYVLEVDPATGAIPVDASVSVSINYSGPTGSAVPNEAAYVAGVDPNGDMRGVAVDVSGRLQVDGTSDNDFAGPTGAPAPAEAGYVAGVDGNGNLVGLAVDATGQLFVDVVASALPSGAATEAKQDSEIALLTTIDADTSSIATNAATIASNTTNIASDTATIASNTTSIASDTATIAAVTTFIASDIATITADTTSIDGKTPTLGQKTMAGSTPVVIASDQSAIPASQSGTWNITNISGTVSLPTGAATEAKQDDAITELQSIVSELQSINGATKLSVKDKVNLNYASTNVTTSAYVEIVSSTSDDIYKFTSFEGSGQGMILATGAPSSEVDLLYIPPGGIDGEVTVNIPAGTRLSIKAINATASSGRFIANFMGP